MNRLCLATATVCRLSVWCAMVLTAEIAFAAQPGTLLVDPPKVDLSGPNSRMTLLVTEASADGRPLDRTHDATYFSRQPEIATVSPQGLVTGHANGETQIDIRSGDKQISIAVRMHDATQSRPLHFENDVIPILSKHGCNSGGCHGKAEGQNGFKLSIFGFDVDADYAALTAEGRGRRLFLASPAQSLLLQKACGDMPHGGGIRIAKGSDDYQMLLDWLIAGAPIGPGDAPRIESLELSPGDRTMAPRERQQLRAVATFSDGSRVDVTRHAKFQSNNEALAQIDDKGLVTIGDLPGEAALMAGYLGTVDVFRVMIPQPKQYDEFPQRPVHNFIDELVDDKLRQLNIAPSELCRDEEYLRRVSLDVIGTLPTPAEIRAFLEDASPTKRRDVVDRLLSRPEYADYWALKWSDLLRVDRDALGRKGAYRYYRWIRESVAANVPFDRFVTELLTAEGPLEDSPAGYLHKVAKKPGEAASTISQVFLGVRIECAQCHHHPFDRWSQSDYFGMEAYFAAVAFKPSATGEMMTAANPAKSMHPRTGEVILPHPLGSVSPPDETNSDQRSALAKWMTSGENPWFARNIANRYWAHFLGRGIVEPVDDFRSTNPPSNPALLDRLAEEFVRSGFDRRQLIRTITASRTYQLSTLPTDSNRNDEQNYSRALFRQMDAEVLFDAVCGTTGVPEKFDGMPLGTRAIALWDSQVPHTFLKLFGRPVRATPCECERAAEPGVAQVLHVLNSPGLQAKLSHAGGNIHNLVAAHTDNDRLTDELYLTFYSRFPATEERTVVREYLRQHADQRLLAVEDLAWSLMNSVEFLFNH